jgi:Rrf2 family protein
VQEIAAAEDLPTPALAAVLQQLGRAGLIRSHKGPGGGFLLARSASDITLYQIMEAVDKTRDLFACALGFAQCSEQTACPVHDRLIDVRQQLIAYLQAVTVADMAAVMMQKRQPSSLP